uniref:Uncharacterized protein n=1 Tax=Arundo donax TaxID=35708 RepID=A0A0A8ZXL9_ARUDO
MASIPCRQEVNNFQCLRDIFRQGPVHGTIPARTMFHPILRTRSSMKVDYTFQTISLHP